MLSIFWEMHIRKKGDSKNAIKIYNQVIELFPNTEKARRAKDYLKELES